LARKRSSPSGKLTTSVARYSGWVALSRRAEWSAWRSESCRAAETVEDHHRALDAGGAELVERIEVEAKVSPLFTRSSTSSSPDSAPT
jgi:hypothetical protein